MNIIIVFAILPALGLANAAATLVGQNLGAGQPARAEKSVWRAARYNMIFLGLVSVLFLLQAETIIGLFTIDDQVMKYGAQGLQVICLGYMFYAYGMVISQSFNGAGDTYTPTALNFVGFWLLQIPLAYVLAMQLEWGPAGVYTAIVLAESMLAVISIFVFRRGTWKKMQV